VIPASNRPGRTSARRRDISTVTARPPMTGPTIRLPRRSADQARP